MYPVMLRGTSHQEQTSMRQFQFYFWKMFFTFVFQDKPTRRPKTDRSDYRVLTQFRFVVAMPRNRIAFIAIQVQQDTVKPGSIRISSITADFTEKGFNSCYTRENLQTTVRSGLILKYIQADGTRPQLDQPLYSQSNNRNR